MIKHCPVATAALLVSSIVASVPALAQSVPPPAPSIYPDLHNQRLILRGQERTFKTQQERRKAAANANNQRNTAAIPDDVRDLVKTTAFSVLTPEYNRRITANGKGSAGQWLETAARSIGQQTSSLRPEYIKRVKTQGRNQANSWYVAQTRSISQRYVVNSER